MSQQPYVEDVGEDGPYEACHAFVGQPGQDASPAGALPEAPMPPAASTEEQVNVFDFLVSSGQTPNASNMNLVMEQRDRDAGENTSLVRYECEPDKYLVAEGEQGFIQGDAGIQPPADGAFVTPVASKAERRRSKESELKKDKKRKRLDVDIPGDQVMTDAPPVLHSGLTGGLKGLMRPVYPPSPDYSGGDANDNSLTSPLKKTKHSKHAKNSQVSHSLFDMITGGVKKPSKKKSKKHSHRHSSKKDAKLIEFSPSQSKNNKADGTDGQMIVFKPRADAFLSFVNKGPESEKGCSMNKTLKRFHRERQSSGSNLAKAKAEKELWRTLRMRRNDRGEIVLFAVEDGQ